MEKRSFLVILFLFAWRTCELIDDGLESLGNFAKKFDFSRFSDAHRA